MEVSVKEIGKRFNFNWIFRNLSHTFTAGRPTVLLGSNGSGKSTLLQILAGAAHPSAGEIIWKQDGIAVPPESVYRYIGYAAPYMDIIDEFSFREQLGFHFSLKAACGNIPVREIIELSGLKKAADRRLSYFSSGMKQRVKLTLAILSDTPLLLLDEPLSNLDRQATRWYRELIRDFGKERTIIVCSNSQEEEYDFCKQSVVLEDYR